MARAVARKKGGRRVYLRKRVAKKRTVVRRVQRKPRKMVYRKRAQPRRRVVQKKRKVRIAKRKVNNNRKRRAPKKVVHRRGRKQAPVPVVQPPIPVVQPPVVRKKPTLVKDLKRRKEIVSMVIDEIQNNGGLDVMKRFRNPYDGSMGLNKIGLRATESASGAYIGNAQVVYDDEAVNVFIKMFIAEDLSDTSPSFSLLTEACISNEISEGKYSNIPTLMNSYGVLYSTKKVNNFYGNIPYDLPKHDNVLRLNGDPQQPFHPIYLINERADELGSPAITLDRFIKNVPTSSNKNDYVKSLFFTDPNFTTLRKDVYSVFVQLMLTLKLMHEAGLYHNDIHYGNIFVVPLRTSNYVTLGNVTMMTDYVIRVYDWDRSFSDGCNPLKNNLEKFFALCQSVRDPTNFLDNECYKPHEDFAWGDFWLSMYSFIIGNERFGDSTSAPIINARAKELINLLTNMTYNGEFWSEKHGIDFDNMIVNLKPEHLAQLRS